MALLPKLELRQGQQLVMTPQLQQAIRLLQLSNVELCSFVEAEVERNPLLEAEAVAPEPALREKPSRAASDSDGDEGDDREWAAAGDAFPHNSDAHEAAGANAAPALNGAGGDVGGWASVRQRTSNAFGGEESNLEDYVAAGQSLADHLTEQLHVAVTDPAERLIGAHLIHMVDETGLSARRPRRSRREAGRSGRV